MSETLIRVAANSHPPAVASAMAGQMRRDGQALAQAIGANAVNQMVKAAALAARDLEAEGQTLVCVPSFARITINGQEYTAIRFALSWPPPGC